MQIPKKTDNLTVYFALSGSAPIKAACGTLTKLTPGLDSTKIGEVKFFFENDGKLNLFM